MSAINTEWQKTPTKKKLWNKLEHKNLWMTKMQQFSFHFWKTNLFDNWIPEFKPENKKIKFSMCSFCLGPQTNKQIKKTCLFIYISVCGQCGDTV